MMTTERMRALALAGVLAAGSLGLQACSSAEPETTDTQSIDLGLALVSGANALSSAGDATTDSSVGGTTRIAMKPARSTNLVEFPDQPDCDEDRSGWPSQELFPDGGGGSGGTAEYNQAFMSCVMKSADTGGETPLGAIAQVYGYLCALGGADEMILDGASHDTSITIDTNCFSQAAVDQMTVDGAATAEVSYIGSTTEFYGNTTGAWTGSLRITGSMTVGGETFSTDNILLYKEQTGGVTIAAVAGPNADWNQGSAYDGFMIQVDSSNGIVRFENRFSSYFDGTTLANPRNRHIKMLLEGDMQSNGAFSNLTKAEVIYSNLWETSSSSSNLAAIKTLQGNSIDGYFMNTYEQTAGSTQANLADASLYTNALSFCLTTDVGTCEGATGITLEDNADTAFIILPSTTSTSEEWFTSLVPPSYDSVSWTD